MVRPQQPEVRHGVLHSRPPESNTPRAEGILLVAGSAVKLRRTRRAPGAAHPDCFWRLSVDATGRRPVICAATSGAGVRNQAGTSFGGRAMRGCRNEVPSLIDGIMPVIRSEAPDDAFTPRPVSPQASASGSFAGLPYTQTILDPPASIALCVPRAVLPQRATRRTSANTCN